MLGKKSDIEHRSALSKAVNSWRRIRQGSKGNYILELIMKALLQKKNGKEEGFLAFKGGRKKRAKNEIKTNDKAFSIHRTENTLSSV